MLKNREAATDWGEFATPDLNPWSKKMANRFLLCCLLDYQLRSDLCWANGYRLIDDILGDPEDVWMAITSVPLREWQSKHGTYKLHRFPAAHDRLHRIGQNICARCDGDARRIWENQDAKTTLQLLWDLKCGDQIGRMIVGALRDCGQLKAQGSDVKADVYVRRVLGRALIGKEAGPETAVELARKLHRHDPWLLDAPIWNLGKTICHASNPECPNCYLAAHCAYRSSVVGPSGARRTHNESMQNPDAAGAESDLAAQFNLEIEGIIQKESQVGLCSTRFIEGVRTYGAIAYAHRLLAKAESDLPKNTFTFIRNKGRLDLTMEYYVVQDRFASLFSASERDVAHYRLDRGD